MTLGIYIIHRYICNIKFYIINDFGLQAKQLGKLLDEDPAIMQRRVSLAKRLELYRAAQAEIDSVAWSK